jgi:23S rRNA G2069 N7-methylase RlmK/C1962 C5-methylase RlmI
MKIIFNENEKNEKRYVAPAAKAKHFRKALVITKDYDLDNITADTLDELLAFVVDVFNNQFSIDDIYEGVGSAALIQIVADTIQHVVGETPDDKKK